MVNREIIQERQDISTAQVILRRTSLDTQRLKDKINELARIIPEVDRKIDSTAQIKFYEEKQSEAEHNRLKDK